MTEENDSIENSPTNSEIVDKNVDTIEDENHPFELDNRNQPLTEEEIGQEENESDISDESSSRKPYILEGLTYIGIGLLVGIVLAGTGYFRLASSQSSAASHLISNDACLGATTNPSGFCFNSPVSVTSKTSNPISQIAAQSSETKVAATKARIGIFGNSILSMDLKGIGASSINSGTKLSTQNISSVNGSFSMEYKSLTQSLQSGSSNAASIYYYGKNEIATSNEITYQGKLIPLVVISKISLSNGSLYLAPVTVNALGHSAPASSVFSSTSPVPVSIPKLPKGLKYTSLDTTKQYLTFGFKGNNVAVNSLFNAK